MALGTALLTLFELLGFCLGFASIGNMLLRFLKLEMESDSVHFLCAVAAGLVTSEVLLFLVQITQRVRTGCLGVAALLCGFLILEWKPVSERLTGALRQMLLHSALSRILLTLVIVVLLVEFLSAMAPLTGSDALNYHFAAQKQIVERGFHGDFSNDLSFLCGQHHLLILFGLALGSKQLAMGFIFLGGVLTAASLVCLAVRWAPGPVTAGFTLLFLLTPLVFWQVTTAGSPDVYMAFFTTLAVIVFCEGSSAQALPRAFLVGLLAGGIAGAKYTGCFIAAALAIAVAVELRSVAGTSIFVAGSLVSGVWPYLRNLVWTGNPLFPYLGDRLGGALVTKYAMANLYSSTVLSNNNVMQILPYALFAGAGSSIPGLWEFYGPTVLILAPSIVIAFRAFRNERRWRVVTIVWVGASLGIFYLSGLPRYLFPVFPLALAAAAAGFEVLSRERWTVARRLIGSLLVLVGLSQAAGLAIYSRRPLRVAIGLERKEEYLRERGPEYQVAEAINGVLGSREHQQRALVFLRHLYYLDPPYVNGNPGTDLEVDPERLQSAQDWRDFFERKNIAYIARSPNYPSVIAKPLEEMEREGDLIPIVSMEVQNFQGNRVEERRAAIAVVILKVKH